MRKKHYLFLLFLVGILMCTQNQVQAKENTKQEKIQNAIKIMDEDKVSLETKKIIIEK
ncbi:hypothetical protein HMPREF9126_1612 [Parvimonas sp. oral taxon 110 str. F0139]|nr:hypothetical protein HMPREF9126_1612 [Parvimonas sp. oral taxon 110 str. F0139]